MPTIPPNPTPTIELFAPDPYYDDSDPGPGTSEAVLAYRRAAGDLELSAGRRQRLAALADAIESGMATGADCDGEDGAGPAGDLVGRYGPAWVHDAGERG